MASMIENPSKDNLRAAIRLARPGPARVAASNENMRQCTKFREFSQM